jgi:hypothetical protein
MNNKNIIAVRNLIRSISPHNLRSPEVVANLVRAFGLVQWGGDAFGDDELFKNQSSDMAGIYQTPMQIAEALVYLSMFEINSFLEVGVFHGGNFFFTSEYLKRFNPEISCTGVDPTEYLNPEIKEIIDREQYLSFKSLSSETLAGQKFDLVLIDGDHTTEWVKKDWENVGQHAKICMFHDIQGDPCPDVVEFWKKLKADYPNNIVKEFISYTKKPTQGIGIIHNDKKGCKA